ncbi:DUF4402 domain-containing protein [Sphingomicrobium lutaoense]|uniref:DUF4402 domain-containing protein n=1 Tax=Sphingomicrobium lutaoense TaxID=515949 RepID=A0A839Z2S9_9SPHN|nr:DUF4402 domain-containing protein [Sphingomicrobium lutaoense]MBB3764063.1 hypothetical protein [Sphingomicrobium lutaoense]
MQLRNLFATLSLAGALFAAPGEASAQGKSQGAKVKVKVLKPLSLTSLQDLDFGTVAVPTIASPVTISIGQDGTLDCPAPLACSGVAMPALYNVKGSKEAAVIVTIVANDLVNPIDGSRLAFTPDGPDRIQLPNNGNKGLDFAVGGAIRIEPDSSGDYEGTIEVVVDYE